MNEKNLARQITCLGEVNGGYKNGIINIYVNMWGFPSKQTT